MIIRRNLTFDDVAPCFPFTKVGNTQIGGKGAPPFAKGRPGGIDPRVPLPPKHREPTP
jgi:hypothetical protein